MLSSSIPRGFAARCPRGHRPAQNLSQLDLMRPRTEFYCVLCDLWWTPNDTERDIALTSVMNTGFAQEPVDGAEVGVLVFRCERCGGDTQVHYQRLTPPVDCSDGVVECQDCGHANRPALPGPILDVFRR